MLDMFQYAFMQKAFLVGILLAAGVNPMPELLQ